MRGLDKEVQRFDSSEMADPKRILYVHNSADLYGASRSLARLLSVLRRDRFTPVVVLPSTGPLQRLLEQTGTEMVVHPCLTIIERSLLKSWRAPFLPFRFLASAIYLRQIIRRLRIDLVHTNTGVIPSPALAARLAGVPHIWHIRDWFQEFRGAWPPYARYMASFSQRLIAVSESIAAQFPDRRHVTVLHNGFDLNEFAVPKIALARAFRERWGIGDAFLVGCVGRIKLVRKGQEVLVQAMARLCKVVPTARCVIVGSVFPDNESHLAELKRLIHDLGMDRQIVFTGEIADPREVYSALDVFVLPSAQPEPFGGVVMEAMAMGVPVIASAIGGSVEQVAERQTGFLIPPANPEVLSARLEELFRDPELRSRMAAAGPRRIAGHFALGDKVAELQRIYDEVIDASASR